MIALNLLIDGQWAGDRKLTAISCQRITSAHPLLPSPRITKTKLNRQLYANPIRSRLYINSRAIIRNRNKRNRADISEQRASLDGWKQSISSRKSRNGFVFNWVEKNARQPKLARGAGLRAIVWFCAWDPMICAITQPCSSLNHGFKTAWALGLLHTLKLDGVCTDWICSGRQLTFIHDLFRRPWWSGLDKDGKMYLLPSRQRTASATLVYSSDRCNSTRVSSCIIYSTLMGVFNLIQYLEGEAN